MEGYPVLLNTKNKTPRPGNLSETASRRRFCTKHPGYPRVRKLGSSRHLRRDVSGDLETESGGAGQFEHSGARDQGRED